MEGYIPRIVDSQLDEFLTGLPAISVEGPRAVGKTETALRRAETVHRFDDDTALAIARAEPARLAAGRPPVLIDEWQRLPVSWDVVRRAVDADPVGSRFLLTGSAAPAQAPTHTGAGRIVTLRMRPLSLAERHPATTVSLAELLAGIRPRLEGSSSLALTDYAQEITQSGFPALRNTSPRLVRAQLDGYIHRIADYDVAQTGTNFRDPQALQGWLTAYAAAVATPTSFTKIALAAAAGESPPARSTALAFRNALERLWMIEPVPAWLPTNNRLRRLATAPVHQLADPALAARVLGIGTDGLLEGRPGRVTLPRTGTLFGALFESLVTLSVRVYAQANDARVAHLRTRSGEQEIDLIVERTDGCVVALEVKLAAAVSDDDVRHLLWLQQRLGPRLLDAAVISTGPEAYRRSDGIGVIPAALLGA